MVEEEVSPKVYLVTGASRGIGREIACTLASAKRDGALILTYRSSEMDAYSLKAQLESSGNEILIAQCDIGSHESVTSLIAQVRSKFGRLDLLVNNAGITIDGSLIQLDPVDIERVVRTNVCGTLDITLQAMDLLVAAKGSIVMVSSVAALKGKEGQAVYSASKGAILGMTRILARRYGPIGVRTNAVAPGFVSTDMVTKLDPSQYEHVLRAATLSRIGKPHEVAAAVCFLGSREASYVNGAVFSVDGGLQK